MSEIDEMQAGAELDALVAQHVFGWKWWRYRFGQYTEDGEQAYKTIFVRSLQPPNFPPTEQWKKWGEEAGLSPAQGTEPIHRLQGLSDSSLADLVPCFSTDIGAAWEVVEKMRERRLWVDVQSAEHLRTREKWRVVIHEMPDFAICNGVGEASRVPEFVGWGMTAPLAICRAALKALEAQQ